MNSSLKIGAVSGLIAGFVSGLVDIISTYLCAIFVFVSPDTVTIYAHAYEVSIVVGIAFGILAGLIYSRVYDVIPSKGVWKGVIFGLVIYCIVGVRGVCFNLAYGDYLSAGTSLLTFAFDWILLGLILGLLYEFLQSRYPLAKERLKVEVYDFRSGLLPGAIAGLLGGLAAAFANIIGPASGLFKIPGAPTAPTLDFLISQAGAHVFVNMVWGVFFAAIFAEVYNLVPSKGIVRGLIFSLIIYLFGTFQGDMYLLGWGLKLRITDLVFGGVWGVFTGFFQALVYGLALGVLYRKPSD